MVGMALRERVTRNSSVEKFDGTPPSKIVDRNFTHVPSAVLQRFEKEGV
jgi:hypothetical protein